jgi:cardiolipin synthase
VVISKDVIILLGIAVLSIMDIAFRVQPLFVSKITTALQIAVVFFALLFKAFPLLAVDGSWLLLLYWSTAAFTVVSGYHYVVKGVRLINST